MASLVFLSGDFCSGSTLLFTLFRQIEAFCCLYEPLHELLPEYLVWPLRAYEHHFFVGNYFDEYRGMRLIPALFKPEWGYSGLYLPADGDAPDLYRYLSYLIAAAFERKPRVLLKFNRATFRLPWLRARFPEAKIVHIWRAPDAQWRSIVRRGQAHAGRSDIGQEAPTFNGFNLARWCDDLQNQFPELAVDQCRTGYERFLRLWELSRCFNQRYADISIRYEALTEDFAHTCEQICDCVGGTIDVAALRQYVVPPVEQPQLAGRRPDWRDRIDRVGRRYAHLRVLMGRRWRNFRAGGTAS